MKIAAGLQPTPPSKKRRGNVRGMLALKEKGGEISVVLII
jgi:hypothetical protein